ncbi:hypothetical protein F53441_5268 [Fusarium austroafricanum]|uniref:Uncharacterized protein n=1 Tax=Fusarium austroafricanum TaxID=2364996 RepID=A0A8H4KLB3_9HYPO|nr:hypothetical protein F53441_5268 [Fusarium austroafricanum]
MSWLPKDLYPEGSGIESKLIEDIVVKDIIDSGLARRKQLDLAAVLTVMLATEAAKDASSSEYYDEGEMEGERVIQEEDDVEEEYDDEEVFDDEEQEFEESYDEEEEEDYDDDDDEEDYDEDDDLSSWGSLRFLVCGMPVENAEPNPITRKRSLTREETPCPLPINSAKRQRVDTSAVSKATEAQVPETEVPILTSEARPEWLRVPRQEICNTEIPRPLRSLLQGLPINSLHHEAQAFLLALDFLTPGSKDLAKAVIDMGLRFSKTAKRNEYRIVINNLTKKPLHAVIYNNAHDDEARHLLFWDKVQELTGRAIPPERLSERRETRRRREAEHFAKARARQAEEEAKREAYQKLKEQFVKKLNEGEAKKLPLNDRVRKWLKEIVPVQKQ